MLAPWIIEEILKREQQRYEQERERLHQELPLERPEDLRVPATQPAEETERGVAIIDI